MAVLHAVLFIKFSTLMPEQNVQQFADEIVLVQLIESIKTTSIEMLVQEYLKK